MPERWKPSPTGVSACAHLTPTLTTIHQPRRLIGERAAHLLTAMIGGESPTCDSDEIGIELIHRGSVRALV